ncbi:Eco57I restriction-modification methylase domain-containing protein, partial [Methanothrix sp.]
MRIKNKELENINYSGGLLSEHFIALMREESISHPLVAPKTFRVPWSKSVAALDKKEYKLRISRAWKEMLERWDLYGYGKLQSMDAADARRRWTMPLLEALGFEPVSTPKHIEISDSMKFRFSHRGWIESPDNGKPPVVHIVPPAQDLDERPEKGQPCPHDALQAYLNVHGDKWGLVTNGLYLRLLRDYHHTYTKGYIEFDLEAIFLTRSYSDFHALYRLAHASRFMPSESGEIYLEEYFNHNQAVGEKVGAGLRRSVISAINTLGNGFLDAAFVSELRGDQDKCHRFYEEILKTIYRIIFLLYAEQRGMLGGSSGNNLYLEEYSLSALRERAARHSKEDGHKDLWIGLQNTFRMIWKGVPELGIYPYNGMLFETSGEEYTSRFGCKNSDLLEAIRFLTLTEIDGTARRINYSEINVEEIGSIYESLLDFAPRITDQPEEIEGISYPANSFILDPRGSARKTTGSYYTHPDLVQELIKSALEPVLAERLNSAGSGKEVRERAILSIKVCDMTSGSGAFLIAACNRLALELARVRTEPTVPDDDAIQEAKRDVLQSCIYGVDLNPMAVELTKVSLWINAMVKDKPLNFLDHHVKCGNSLIGATPELIAKGVPDEAFKAVTGDDKKISKHFKDINKKQRIAKGVTLFRWSEKALMDYADDFSRLSDMVENTA